MAHEATLRGIGVGVGVGGGGAPVVLLETRGAVIPIFVDAGQAQEIERARDGVPAPRPMTHDLFVDVIDNLDGTLERVRIDDLVDNTFHAKLDLTVDRGGDRTQIVCDARASDGMALAVRVECPITVADAVIDEAGLDPAQLGSGAAGAGAGGSADTDLDVGSGSTSTDIGTSEEPESIDPDDAVDIYIDDPDDADEDDESES